ncbi:hypothetical protein ACEQUB_p01339 (plasmid) [Ralstonia syzygii]|uniref:Uncharacterized protein n=1 Tax=Ralstonia syzygii R24 TaxID=907261 RepID=G3ABJ5_9RALS|nr:conserved hypothetical protein [Ralstonia syzygii R24]
MSAFMWQGLAGMVLRTINTRMPSLGRPDFPLILNAAAMRKRGLVVVAGATGSGTSTWQGRRCRRAMKRDVKSML